jgi:hypothetical protein
VFEPAPAGKAALVITGASTGGVNGTVVYCGLVNGKPAWSNDASQTLSDTNTLVDYTGTQWRVRRGSVYTAVKTSAAATPDGLTTWTVSPGTGSPVIAALAAPNPAVITA